MGEKLKSHVYPVPAVSQLRYRVLYDALLHLSDDSFYHTEPASDIQECVFLNELRLKAFAHYPACMDNSFIYDADDAAVLAVYHAVLDIELSVLCDLL